MLFGAIIGDIVGSVYEFSNIKTKDFPLFSKENCITDDTCMTVAIANALLLWKKNGGDLQDIVAKSMQNIGQEYPDMDYGFNFYNWLYEKNPKPYNSFGNGSAMRISSVGWVGKSLDEVKKLSYIVTVVTHNHIEGIKGAEAVATAIFLAKTKHNKDYIKKYICENYYNNFLSVEDLQKNYGWDETCQGTVSQALQCFFESTDFEDAIRNAVSIGGDSDTIAAITGSVAEAYYGIPNNLIEEAKIYIPENLLDIVMNFEQFF